ncbi:hemagglutinin repeat-containing protein [Lonepinella sp. BR2357]|uniref:hemagglutinin repeat-containing protein n=1 Tax=Lonepinella sp. BR2357 TaxID=3434549 RepID=UPI003F6DB8EF
MGSQVGSLHGKTQIITDGNYQQSGSIVTSKDGDVLIMAKNANITGVESDYESNYKYQMKQSGLTVAVNIPALQALQSAISTVKSIKTVGQSKDDRINALALANVGFGAVRTYEQGKDLYKNLQENGIDGLKQDVSVSITYGKQKNTQTQHTDGNKVEKSQINAGGKVNIITTSTEKNDDLTIMGSDVSGNQGTHLSSQNNVNILAMDENHHERSKNKSSGWNAGVAVSYGQSGFSFGVTAGGKIAKGYGNGDSKAWVESYVGSQNSQTTIDSKKDTNIKGSQVAGKQITVNAQNLNIESLQDTATYKGKQESASGQVTVGYGVSASASYSQSKINSNYASVNQQAGIFAGDDGFKVNVANHTNLTGALITSTESAEENSRNSFSTGTLSYSDIENISESKASGFGLNGGLTISGGNDPDKTVGKEDSAKDVGAIKLTKMADNNLDCSSKIETQGVAGVFNQGNWGITKGLVTGLLGQVNQKSKDNSITSSRIQTQNIQIRDEQQQFKNTGKTIQQTITELNQDNQHRVLENINVDQIQSDLNQDLNVATDFVNNIGERGDQIYYKMEKNEDSSFIIKKEYASCEHTDCIERDDPLKLKELIYSDQILTEKQAKELSVINTAGMLNLKDKDKIDSAVLYGNDLSNLDDIGVIINRGSAGLVNEFIFTGFERFRAWANMPTIFGASNATKDKVQLSNKINEYNQSALAQGKQTVDVTQIAHSLGVSGDKNALNWAEYQGMKYDSTKVNYYHLGGSYSSEQIDNQAKSIYKNTTTHYLGTEGDSIYQGIGGYFIGNNKNATPVPKGLDLSFGERHSESNQNINNLKYVYRINNEQLLMQKEKTIYILNNIHKNNGIRIFNKVGDHE